MVPAFITIVVVLIVVLGSFAQSYVKNNKESNRLFRKDIIKMIERMDQLEADMAEQKELVADTIIEQS